MAESNFKHLEMIPLDEENLIDNDDPESNLRSKACINLGFNGVSAVNRLKKLNDVNKLSVGITYSSFLDLSYILESVLTTVLTLNTLSNPQNTEITEHYRRYTLQVATGKILPSFAYCQNLTFTRFKTWGGMYGTLQYYMYLLEDYKEYLTPSEIVYFSSKSLYQYTKNITYNEYLNNSNNVYLLASRLYDNLLDLLEDESENADRAIYNFSKEIITGLPIVNSAYTELQFFETWLQQVFQWFASTNTKPIIIPQPANNIERGQNTLLKVIKAVYRNGFDYNSFNNISTKLIRQTASPALYAALKDIAQVRNESTYIVNLSTNTGTTIDNLVTEFHSRIPPLRQPLDYIDASNVVLKSMTPPSGYSLLLTSLAANLINRAYILSHRSINVPGDMRDSVNYRRALKLLGYAGILLIKSGLPHGQALGINILTAFKVRITDIDPNNLLDIYS